MVDIGVFTFSDFPEAGAWVLPVGADLDLPHPVTQGLLSSPKVQAGQIPGFQDTCLEKASVGCPGTSWHLWLLCHATTPGRTAFLSSLPA